MAASVLTARLPGSVERQYLAMDTAKQTPENANGHRRGVHWLRSLVVGLLLAGLFASCLVGLGEQRLGLRQALLTAGWGGSFLGCILPCGGGGFELERFRLGWASSLCAVGAGCFGADGGWDRAEGLGCLVFGGHGIWWLIGASAPADGRTITQRRVIARKISNYFHGPIPGLSHNSKL